MGVQSKKAAARMASSSFSSPGAAPPPPPSLPSAASSSLVPILLVGMALAASRFVVLPPAWTSGAVGWGGIPVDRWQQAIDTLLLCLGAWQIGAFLLLSFARTLAALTDTAADDAVLELVANYLQGASGGPRLAIIFAALYVSSLPLRLEELYPALALLLEKGLTVALGLWAFCLCWDLLELLLLKAWRTSSPSSLPSSSSSSSSLDPTLVSALGFARPLAVFAGLLALLHSVGVEVSSVIAGFGVGGLAMALSTQTVLQDVSAGLALLVDRPFELGDFVGTGAFKGVVTSIGLKSTTMRAFSGEVLVVCNKEMAGGRVTRYPRVCDRLKTFVLPLDTAATTKQLEKVCANITRLLEKHPFRSQAQQDEENGDEDEGGREGGGGLRVGLVGPVDLTGWCVNVEVNYTLGSATLTELKTTHAEILLGVLQVVSAVGVALVAPPHL